MSLSRVTRRARAALAVLLGMTVLSACSFDVYQLPLPGGADTGDNPITVYADFDDVLDLVPKSSVKVNDITVGEVTDVQLDGYQAMVTMKLRGDTSLPDNTVATIRQTSLLGEKFVSLAGPEAGATGQLSDQDHIEHSGRNPEVEEVLGALSLVLNGGGVAQLKTIANEVNLALDGREDSAKSVLTQVATLVKNLDNHKADIVKAIESVNRLAVTARKHQKSIDLALDELPSALDSIDKQRTDLVAMLQGLSRLGNVGVRVINATRVSTLSTLRTLFPVLNEVAKAGDDFVDGFSTFLTYPFVDETVGRDPQVAKNLHMGDYVNLSIDLQLDLGNLQLPDVVCIPINQLPDSPLDKLINLKNLCAGATAALQACIKTPPNIADCAKLPKYLLDNVCTAIPLLCGKLPLRSTSPTASRAPMDNLLGTVLTGGGLGRAAPGATSQRDQMWSDFDKEYDADLVSLYGAPILVGTAQAKEARR